VSACVASSQAAEQTWPHPLSHQCRTTTRTMSCQVRICLLWALFLLTVLCQQPMCSQRHPPQPVRWVRIVFLLSCNWHASEASHTAAYTPSSPPRSASMLPAWVCPVGSVLFKSHHLVRTEPLCLPGCVHVYVAPHHTSLPSSLALCPVRHTTHGQPSLPHQAMSTFLWLR
jgi:hypothetical protein